MKNKKKVIDKLGFDFETTKTGGFAASWKPESEGETIIVTPTENIRQLPKKKGVKKQGSVMECIYRSGTSDNFYSGKTQVELKNGETVNIMLSFNLMDELALAVESQGKVILSKLSKLVISEGSVMRLIFDGNVKIGGGRSVNKYTVQAPKGFKERVLFGKVKK